MKKWVLLVVVLGGCASPIKEAWVPAPDYWEQARVQGARLIYKDRSAVRFVNADVVNNLVTVKERVERVSGVYATLALVDMDQPNAFVTMYQGKPLVAFSLSFLEKLGYHRNALATTMGHELAHLRLGHSAEERKKREQAAYAAGNVAGALINAVIPFGGTIASVAITGYARSFSRDEEREADSLGLKWAVEAGYDPCGQAEVVEKLGKAEIPFLSTHPSYSERSEQAEKMSQEVNGRSCN